jgi:D-xylose transport system ATP-binding protein
MRDISIAFGGIRAVDSASVDLYPGEVMALLGHNGAGKSTLIKILSGAYKRDSGQIMVRGEEANINNPRDAKNTASRRSIRRLPWPIMSMPPPIYSLGAS